MLGRSYSAYATAGTIEGCLETQASQIKLHLYTNTIYTINNNNNTKNNRNNNHHHHFNTTFMCELKLFVK